MADEFKPGVGGSYRLNEDGTIDLVERTQEAPPLPPAPEPDQP